MSIYAIALYDFLHGQSMENPFFQSFLANWGRSDIPNDCASVSWGHSAAALCTNNSLTRLPQQLLATDTSVWLYRKILLNPGRSIFRAIAISMVPSVAWSYWTAQIDRHNVNDILSRTTTQGCRGSIYALCSCQHLMSVDTSSRYSLP
jgi:hypothetical protein